MYRSTTKDEGRQTEETKEKFKKEFEKITTDRSNVAFLTHGLENQLTATLFSSLMKTHFKDRRAKTT